MDDFGTESFENSLDSRFTKKEQLIEVSVFLSLILPSMALSFFAIKQGALNFVLVAISTILRDLALVGLILFFIWRNGEPIKLIGWTFKNAYRQIVLGIVLFVPIFYIAGFLENILHAVGFSAPSTPLPSSLTATGIGQFVLAFILVSIVALAEETMFRGYLIHRFRAVSANPGLAVFLSAFIFSLGHGYEGTAGIITVGFLGIVFALVYLWQKSLVAPIVMHFLLDSVGIILVPLITGK